MKLSIITINYNNAIELEKTIQSVECQSWKDFEYIIIDGGSTDNSVSIIKSHERSLAYWISEKDRGIYHAMNKGIATAKGEYLLMLNSGDALAQPRILEQIFGDDRYTEDVLYGDINWFSKGVYLKKSQFPSELTFQYFWKKSLGHQAAFIRRSLHSVVGLYDENLKFGSDWKFFVLSICKYGASYHFIDMVISHCDAGGLTWRPTNFAAMKAEINTVLEQEFPLYYPDYKELEHVKANTILNRLLRVKQNIKTGIKKVVHYQKRKY